MTTTQRTIATLILATLTLFSLPAQAAMIQSQTSYYNAGNYDTYPSTGLALAQQACEDRGATSYTYNCTTEGYIVTGDFCRNENYQYLIHNGTRYMCSDEEPPPPECPIPEGQVRGLTTNYRISQVCFENCKFEKPQKTICIFLNDGTSRCLSDYTSTGEYCDDEDGASSAPFDDYVDEDGCYNSTDGHRYCESPAEAQCPNYTTVNGKKYCREPEDDDSFDSDGDGLPDVEDPFPDNPDGDGDGLTDNNDPDPGNADTDGDGTPDGQDDDPDGDGEPGYNDGGDGEDGDQDGTGSTEGVCEPGSTIEEPKCTSDLDGVQCLIYLNNWRHRCEAKQEFQQLYGTEAEREPLVAEGTEFLDPENPANQLPGSGEGGASGPNDTTVNFSDAVDMLDDTGFLPASCPSDISYSVFGESFKFTYQPICQMLAMVNPVIVALGWLAAALIIGRSVTGD